MPSGAMWRRRWRRTMRVLHEWLRRGAFRGLPRRGPMWPRSWRGFRRRCGSDEGIMAVKRVFGVVARMAAGVLAALPLPAAAQAAGSDPRGSGPIVAALGWLQGTLLGNVATAVAVRSEEHTSELQ